MKKECDIATSDTFDVATSFDGSWSSRGWTANKGIESAIAEGTCQVLDKMFKSSTCTEYTKMEKKVYIFCYIIKFALQLCNIFYFISKFEDKKFSNSTDLLCTLENGI